MIQSRFWGFGGAIIAALTILQAPAAGGREATVAITSIVERADLDTVRSGIRDALAAKGYIVGQNLLLLYETADADPVKAIAIARRFAAARPDVVVAISAPAALAVVREVKDLPVVITAVTQDSADKILATRRRTRNIAGLVEAVPYRDQLALIAEIAPQTTVVLAPYDQGRPASRATAEKLLEIGGSMAFTIRPVPVTRPEQVVPRLRELISPNTAIFLPGDRTLDMPVEEIAALAAELDLLVVAGNAEAVARGATATVIHDPYTIGWQAGEAVSLILDGARPRDVAVRPANATYLVLNKQAAASSGIELPPALLERAGIVYDAEQPSE